MRHLPLLLVCAALTAAGPVSRQEEGRVDGALQRLAALRPAQHERALVEIAPDRPLPLIPGVAFGSRRGRFVTARGPAAALASLGAVAARVERSRPVRTLNDVSHTSAIAFRGTITGAETDGYSFAATAGQTIRIRVHSEGVLDPFLSVDGAAFTDDNSGPGGDAALSITWVSGGPKLIDVTGAGGTSGDYLLVLSADTPIAPSDLTGGDIGADLPHVAGTRGREARAAEGLDGSGVLLGFVDSGIDLSHPDFRTAGDATRLVGIWDQTLTAIAGERVPSAGYGVHYKQDEIDTPGFVRQVDTDGHGSIVAAIAAGDDPVFTGAAPGASLFMVKFDETSSGVLDGINLILDEAERLGFEAVVINLSLGTHDGPHDGTSLLDQAIGALPQRGRAVVVAAGNEGDPTASIVHAAAVVAAPTSWTFIPTAPSISGIDPPHALDLWGDGPDGYTVAVTDGTNSLTTTSGSSGALPLTLTGVSIAIENETDAPSNGASHIRIEIHSPIPALPWTITLTRTASGGTGQIDGYLASESGSFGPADITLNADGSVPGTVTEPGTAAGAITIGAYRGLFSWDTGAGTTVKADSLGPSVAGNIADFSSRGPTRDGRTKPDLAAPGAWIAGALSADHAADPDDVDSDGAHAYSSGTSMAAPHVAGITALLFQKNRLLLPDELKGLLAATALTDGFTAPGSTWGTGKADAVGLLASVAAQVDIKAHSGGCSSATLNLIASGMLWPLALLAAFLAILIRRRP